MFNSENIHQKLIGREYGDVALGADSLTKNMREGNCSKTLFNGHASRIIALDVDMQGNFAVTACIDKAVKLWNLQERSLQWNRYYDLNSITMCKTGILKIERNHVILASIALDEIKILDLETGIETATIKEPTMNLIKICVVGQSIFTGLATRRQDGVITGDYGVREWTHQGREVRTFHQIKPPSVFPLFIGSSDFVIDNFEKRLFIHDLQKYTSKELELPAAIIKDAHIDNERLICAMSSLEQTDPHFCVIHLKTSQVIHSLRIKDPSLQADNSVLSPRVSKIVSNKEWVYLGYSNGVVIACNLYKKNCSLLGQHSTPIEYLALEGPLLISGSGGGRDKLAEVKFWDLRSCTHIGEMRHPPCLSKICFVANRLLATIQGSLIQWNYLVAHRGEKMTGGSPTQITQTSEECVIQ